jgi:hypothetical protein
LTWSDLRKPHNVIYFETGFELKFLEYIKKLCDLSKSKDFYLLFLDINTDDETLVEFMGLYKHYPLIKFNTNVSENVFVKTSTKVFMSNIPNVFLLDIIASRKFIFVSSCGEWYIYRDNYFDLGKVCSFIGLPDIKYWPKHENGGLLGIITEQEARNILLI